MRRFAAWMLDAGPVVVLALIAGAGSFTHIRDTAAENGQTGWMSWAIAVCIDLTCVMAARERQRDKKSGRRRPGPISWPVLVLAGGIALSLAANLAQATPTAWGWITAATPAGAFLIAVSMLERRAVTWHPAPAPAVGETPQVADPTAVSGTPALVPVGEGTHSGPAPDPALLHYARSLADDHIVRRGTPITREVLRARLGVSDQLASNLLDHIRPTTQSA